MYSDWNGRIVKLWVINIDLLLELVLSLTIY